MSVDGRRLTEKTTADDQFRCLAGRHSARAGAVPDHPPAISSDSDVSPAQRARAVPDEPAVDAGHVEEVAAPRQPPRGLADLEVLQAHGAAQRLARRVHGAVLRRDHRPRQPAHLVLGEAPHAAGLEQVARLVERRADGADLRPRTDGNKLVTAAGQQAADAVTLTMNELLRRSLAVKVSLLMQMPGVKSSWGIN